MTPAAFLWVAFLACATALPFLALTAWAENCESGARFVAWLDEHVR